MKESKRDKLIREAATIDLDGAKWRDRLDKWLVLHKPKPLKFPGFTFRLDTNPMMYYL